MTVKYVVESVAPDGLYATVLFFNPYHSGEHMEVSEGEFQDNDPNPHVRKTITIPYVDGLVDKAKLAEILEGQARGVAARVEGDAQRAVNSHAAQSLIGFTSPSGEG